MNDPASADGFTVIFNKARDEKKSGGSSTKSILKYETRKENDRYKYTSKVFSSKSFKSIYIFFFTISYEFI